MNERNRQNAVITALSPLRQKGSSCLMIKLVIMARAQDDEEFYCCNSERHWPIDSRSRPRVLHQLMIAQRRNIAARGYRNEFRDRLLSESCGERFLAEGGSVLFSYG